MVPQTSEHSRRYKLLQQELSDTKTATARYLERLDDETRRANGAEALLTKQRQNNETDATLADRRTTLQLEDLRASVAESDTSRRKAVEKLHDMLTVQQKNFVLVEEDLR